MEKNTSIFTPVLIVGCLIIMVSFAVRASFGVFQIPIAEEFGWLRSEFSLAIAIQNLAWGIGQPIFGAMAEKIGDRRAIIIGSVVYAVGLVLSANSVSPIEHQTYAWLIGFGIAGTGFGVILAVVGRASTADNRSMSLAVATAAGSAGQVFGAPVAEWMLGFLTWQTTFVVFAGAILAMLLTLPLMHAPEMASKTELEESLGQILAKAFKDPSFSLIFLGFFSCGYQLFPVFDRSQRILRQETRIDKLRQIPHCDHSILVVRKMFHKFFKSFHWTRISQIRTRFVCSLLPLESTKRVV